MAKTTNTTLTCDVCGQVVESFIGAVEIAGQRLDVCTGGCADTPVRDLTEVAFDKDRAAARKHRAEAEARWKAKDVANAILINQNTRAEEAERARSLEDYRAQERYFRDQPNRY